MMLSYLRVNGSGEEEYDDEEEDEEEEDEEGGSRKTLQNDLHERIDDCLCRFLCKT